MTNYLTNQKRNKIKQQNFHLYFSIFGFASLFSVLPHYGIYESQCKKAVEQTMWNTTIIMQNQCSNQIEKYQV